MELFVKIVNNCQFAGSKSTLCGSYSAVHMLIVFHYYLGKPQDKYFKKIEKALNIQYFFKHTVTTHPIYDSQVYTRGNFCFFK